MLSCRQSALIHAAHMHEGDFQPLHAPELTQGQSCTVLSATQQSDGGDAHGGCLHDIWTSLDLNISPTTDPDCCCCCCVVSGVAAVTYFCFVAAEKKWISWWTNRISLCTADAATLQPQACTNFDPRNWTDCMWNAGFETLGVYALDRGGPGHLGMSDRQMVGG